MNENKPVLSPEKKRRNWALLAALMLFVAVVYAVTIVKIQNGMGP